VGVNQYQTESYSWGGILLAAGVYLAFMLLLIAAVEGWLVR